jgi:hypothetical protein
MKHTRETIIKDTVQIKEAGKVIAVNANGIKFFVSRKEFNALKKKHPKLDMVSLIEKAKREYFWVPPTLWKEFIASLASGTDWFYEVIRKCQRRNPFTSIKNGLFDTKDIFWIDWDCHLFYQLDKDMPWSRPYRADYCGGVCNDCYDLNRAQKALKKSPYVFDIQRIKIPWFNSHDDHTHSVEFSFHLPQPIYNRIVRHLRDKNKDEFWSVHIEHAVLPHWGYGEFDPLKLKGALK